MKKTKEHKRIRMKYNGSRRYGEDGESSYKRGEKSIVIASWKCPLCGRVVETGMPRDRKDLVVACDGK